MIKVKICGITSRLAFDTAVEAGVDWVGFVFFPPSPRYVTPQAAAALSAHSAGGPPRVGLFVEPSIAAIKTALAEVDLDVLQIYGAIPLLPEITTRFGLPIWRAVGVSAAVDLPVDPLGADRLVLEAKPPPGADRPGGNAASFDWTVMRGWKPPVPWILAGGLTPDNVAEAIQEAGAEAVDVSSGVERESGVKDPSLIRAFVAAARSVG